MSETKVPFLAPGCFGSASLFESDNMVCVACPFREECEPAHQIALQAMRDRLGIKAPVLRKRTAAPAQPVPEGVDEDSARMTLPKKVRELLGRLDRESFDIVAKVKQGINPFAGMDSYRYMMITCHLIMHMNVPVTQKLVAEGLRRSLNWAEGTADAHARMAIQALTHVGAIDNNDGILSVRRA